jgi:hypothetical protein
LIPVLVYVIIKVRIPARKILSYSWRESETVIALTFAQFQTNPPSLLSTVQYVDSFYRNRLEGEEQYWWTQFCSAIEFIKTMD